MERFGLILHVGKVVHPYRVLNQFELLCSHRSKIFLFLFISNLTIESQLMWIVKSLS